MNFDEITYDELKKLWWDETISDGRIAELYGVNHRQVTNKRRDWDITTSGIRVSSFLKCICVDNDTEKIVISEEVQNVINLLKNLSDEDSHNFITFLIKNNPKLKELNSKAKNLDAFVKSMNM